MKAFDFEQVSAAAVWTIVHNANTDNVAIDVMVDDGGTLRKIIPSDIRSTDANTVQVTFDQAWTGHARLIG